LSQESQGTPHKTRRSEAFFGRRKSKSLSPKAEQRFDELFPKLRLDPSSKPAQSSHEFFSHKPDQVILEIGFGGGEHIIHQATTYVQNGYIGVEPFVNSMSKALRIIDDQQIKNIRLYDEDAVEVLDWLPEGSIDRIDLLYPDPWPKMRHWKRRFVSMKNLDRFARVLKTGGEFRFASDIDTYINWTLQHCDKHPSFAWSADTAQDWHNPYENWIRTRYEAKAIREKRTPCYLRFERVE
jgi:tRNA (guanine-N7-)-methyltransferase